MNMILLLNFIIAILSSTFAKYEQYKLGLYYNQLNMMMPLLRWNDLHGALVVLRPPIPIYIFMLPFILFFILFGDCCKKSLSRINNFYTSIIFLPISLVLGTIFLLISVLTIPVAYFLNTYRLVTKIIA
jgi:hypothetical protein